jgi:hypothetical protein
VQKEIEKEGEEDEEKEVKKHLNCILSTRRKIETH